MTDTKYKVEGEIRYNARLHERHARLFSRVRTLSNFLSMVSGSAAFAAFSKDATVFGSIASAVIVVLSIADQVCNYGSLAGRHSDARKAYLELLVGLSGQTVEELRAKADGIDARFHDLNIIEALRDVAQNDVLRERGHDSEIVTERFWQRVMRAIA